MKKKASAVSILGWIAAFLLLSITFTSNVMAKTALDPEAARAAQVEKARNALAGTAWTVYTSLQDARKPEEGTESFTFTDRRLTTQWLAQLGYGVDGSNYSLYIEGDTIVWETMARQKDGEGEALLRGDLKDGVMTGVIDIQPAKGQRKVYRFSSQKPQPSITAGTAAATTKPKKR